MGKYYKRIVTMGMISITAAMAWIYCILEHRDKLEYVMLASLAVAISVYALLIGIANLKATKENSLQSYISYVVQSSLEQLNSNTPDNTDLERIVKALYVQVRKNNSAITQIVNNDSEYRQKNLEQQSTYNNEMRRLIAESVNKTVKVIVKYNQENNERLLNTIEELGTRLSEANNQLISVTAELDKIKTEMHSLEIPAPIVQSDSVNTNDSATESVADTDSVLDLFSEEVNNEDTSKDINEETGDSIETTENSSEPESASYDYSDIGLDQNEIDKLFADVIPFPTAEASAEEEEKPVQDEISEEPADPNKIMSPDEIAALFAAMDASTPAAEPEVEPEPEIPQPHNEMTDISEEPADPNKIMSPDEIAALIASMTS